MVRTCSVYPFINKLSKGLSEAENTPGLDDSVKTEMRFWMFRRVKEFMSSSEKCAQNIIPPPNFHLVAKKLYNSWNKLAKQVQIFVLIYFTRKNSSLNSQMFCKTIYFPMNRFLIK